MVFALCGVWQGTQIWPPAHAWPEKSYAEPVIVPVELYVSPWTLPDNKTQSGVKSRSSLNGTPAKYNEFRFEDKKGQEQLFIHAEKNQDIEVENDETHWVGHDRTKTIDHDETTYVKHDRTETVDNNETITVHHDRAERVDNNETISIGVNRTEDVGVNENIIEASLQALVDSLEYALTR